jgi:hypothetical protein
MAVLFEPVEQMSLISVGIDTGGFWNLAVTFVNNLFGA